MSEHHERRVARISANRAHVVALAEQIDRSVVAVEAPRVQRGIANVVCQYPALDGDQLTALLRPSVDTEGLLRQVQELRLIEQLGPLLDALWNSSDDDAVLESVEALGAQLNRRHDAIGPGVQAVLGARRGRAHVATMADAETLRGVAAAPWITEQALHVYDYLQPILPPQRRRQQRPRVAYSQRALALTVDLMNLVYRPLFNQQPLTVPALKARIQTRRRH